MGYDLEFTTELILTTPVVTFATNPFTIQHGGTFAVKFDMGGMPAGSALRINSVDYPVLSCVGDSTLAEGEAPGVGVYLFTYLSSPGPHVTLLNPKPLSGVTKAVGTSDVTLATTAFVNAEIANDAAPIAHVGAGGAAHADVVAGGSDGFMTGADKAKLDGIAANANNYSHPNHSGDVTSTGDGTTAIASKAVTLAKMADMATASILGRKTAAAGSPEVLSKADVLALLNVADGAQVNTVTSVAGKTGAVFLVKGDVGLGNVTNDAQVKKRASSIDGKIPTWNGTAGDALNDGYAVESTLAGSSSAIPRADAVKTYIDGLLAASDTMVFKGSVGVGGTYEIAAFNSLVIYNAGWSYKVITAGTIKGKVCEIGDLLVATVDRAIGGVDADWIVLQTNTDGAVIGPATATDGNIVLFNGATGKLVKNSTYSPASFATAGHNHDATYTKKYATSIGNGSASTFVITHNLNTQDAVISVREVASPYAMIICDIEYTSVNTATLKFASAPASNQFRVVVIG